MIVKRIGSLSMGKMWGAIYGVFGLVVSASNSLYWLLQGGLLSVDGLRGNLSLLLPSVIAIMFLPVLFAAVGFVIGLVIAILYNWLVRLIGGIEVVVE